MLRKISNETYINKRNDQIHVKQRYSFMDTIYLYIMKMKTHIIPLLCLLLAILKMHAQPDAYILKDPSQEIVINPSFYIYEDKSNMLTIDDILLLDDSKFKKSITSKLSFDHTLSSYWAQFSIYNTSDKNAQYVLNVENADINKISFFEIQNGLINRKVHTGECYPLSTREIKHKSFVFLLTLKPGEFKSFYLYTFSYGESVILPLKVQDYEVFFNESKENEHFNVFLFGIVFFIFIFNIFLFIVLRDKLYVTYAIYVIFGMFSIACLQGYTSYYLWQSSTWFADIAGDFFAQISLFSLILFVRDYLNTKENAKICDKILCIIQVYILISLIFSFSPPQYRIVGYITCEISTMLAFILVPLTASIVLRKQFFPAIYVLISYTPLTISVASYFLRSIGIIRNTHILTGIDFSFTFQTLVLAFALVESFRRQQSSILDTLSDQNIEMSKLAIASSETDNGIAIFDSDGNLEWCNKGFENLYHYNSNDITQEFGNNIIDISINENIVDYLEQCIETGLPVIFETEIIDIAGIPRWVQTTLSPITDEDGIIYNFVLIDSDLTNFKNAEEEKKQLQEQLVQAQKMETIGKLAGGIAHDFNNILTPIVGYTEMVMLDLDENSSAYNELKIVLNAAIRAKQLTTQILTFSRHFKEEPKVIYIKDVLTEVINLTKISMNTRITLTQNIKVPEAKIKADPTQIQQVFMNILTNAQQAIDSVGEINITQDIVSFSSEDKKLQIQAGEYIYISISDTGHGMNEDMLTKIFDPFYTTKELGKGTGLGLSVVHGIINKYKGQIFFESTLGKGTTVKIYLPFSVIEEIEDTEKEILIPKGNGEHILIIDDEENITGMLKKALEKQNYKTSVFTDSNEALEYFIQNNKKIHLVLSDQKMPKMNGSELLGKMKKINPSFKAIILTGYSEEISPENAHKFGANTLIYKPVNTKTLLTEIHSLFNINDSKNIS